MSIIIKTKRSYSLSVKDIQLTIVLDVIQKGIKSLYTTNDNFTIYNIVKISHENFMDKTNIATIYYNISLN